MLASFAEWLPLDWLGATAEYTIFGNTVEQLVAAGVIFLVLLVVFFLLQKIIIVRLNQLAKKTQTDIDDMLIEVVNSFRPSFYTFIAIYVAVQLILLPEMLRTGLYFILLFWVVYQVIKGLQVVVDYILQRAVSNGDEDETVAVGVMSGTIKFVLWALGLLLILSNLGVDVTSLIAGLGIGGIAVALAIQNILGDLFSSFAIYLDKPFKPGDFIVVGEHSGVVQKIGVKTTRIKALQGEEIVIANAELTNARVQNFKKLEERRVVAQLGVTYETKDASLEQIPQMVQAVVETAPTARFDRCHFAQFADSALVFELVYYVPSADYTEYMDVQQQINFGIRKAFAKAKIDMAYPTQTLHLVK